VLTAKVSGNSWFPKASSASGREYYSLDGHKIEAVDSQSDGLDSKLSTAWSNYKANYVASDGRVYRPNDNNDTVSEGQAYVMLMAVWRSDQPTFDSAWDWTRKNLQRTNMSGYDDRLFAWHWVNGGIDPNGGHGAATDADEDIALALVFAQSKVNKGNWTDTGKGYGSEAKAVLKDILAKEAVYVNSVPHITAGDWAPGESQPTLNPSYFAPAWYRIFADFTNNTDWDKAADVVYQDIANTTSDTSAGLAPDWAALDKSTGKAQEHSWMDNDYKWDAMRTPWRIALDYDWFGTQAAKDYLSGNLSEFLSAEWLGGNDCTPWTPGSKSICAEYTHSGAVYNGNPYENVGIYGGDVGALLVGNNSLAKDVCQQKIFPELTNKHDYYPDAWAFFGGALCGTRLDNEGAPARQPVASGKCDDGLGWSLPGPNPPSDAIGRSSVHYCGSGLADCCNWYQYAHGHDLGKTITGPVDIEITFAPGRHEGCTGDLMVALSPDGKSWSTIKYIATVSHDLDGKPGYSQTWQRYTNTLSVDTPFRYVLLQHTDCFVDDSVVSVYA
jgi:endo-1,4-beta-D-glucanase Y